MNFLFLILQSFTQAFDEVCFQVLVVPLYIATQCRGGITFEAILFSPPTAQSSTMYRMRVEKYAIKQPYSVNLTIIYFTFMDCVFFIADW